MALSDNKEKIITLLNRINNLPNAGGGNATWAGLPDKPVVMGGGDTLTWDGNTEGLAVAEGMFYKVSDAVPELSDFANGYRMEASDGSKIECAPGDIYTDNGLIFPAQPQFVVVTEDGVGNDFGIGGGAFTETGIYFVNVSEVGIYISSLTIPGYTGFAQEKIAPSHLWQPDWNQNDSTQPDFIKNRPFGDAPTEIMPETEVVGEDMDGDYGVMLDPTLFPEGISELIVIFDGVKYRCVADLTFGFAVYGNMAFLGGDNTGEPFCVVPEHGMIVVVDGTPHSISISGKAAIKLPDKYYDVANYCFTSWNVNDPYIYTDYTLTTKMTWEQLDAFGKDKPVIVKYSNGVVESKAIAWTAVSVETAMGEAGCVVILQGSKPTLLYTAEYQP